MKKRPRPSGNINVFLPSATRRNAGDRQWWADILLRKIGPTWRYSPARRIIQLLCLALFCHLFFYVAWPYATVFTESVLEDKELLPVEFSLWLCPFVGLTTFLAARQ